MFLEHDVGNRSCVPTLPKKPENIPIMGPEKRGETPGIGSVERTPAAPPTAALVRIVEKLALGLLLIAE
jgi:hypothetical protein